MNVGDKVVCVDDSPCKICGVISDLIVNRVYVVQKITQHKCIVVVGIAMKACHISNDGNDWGYVPERFRKLDELKEETRQRQLKE